MNDCTAIAAGVIIQALDDIRKHSSGRSYSAKKFLDSEMLEVFIRGGELHIPRVDFLRRDAVVPRLNKKWRTYLVKHGNISQ